MSASVTESVTRFPSVSHLAPSIQRVFQMSDKPSTSTLLNPTHVKSKYLKKKRELLKISNLNACQYCNNLRTRCLCQRYANVVYGTIRRKHSVVTRHYCFQSNQAGSPQWICVIKFIIHSVQEVNIDWCTHSRARKRERV